ncbi:MAG: hypothetical protein EZS28_006548 [Streblomastix strix]|uniref:Uncharacterized protein n=1 Tax=Streblomastix strix TaxID=222440 RepID=A0A5J4WU34_9EUKA|nr:MAG: hypothetical protein EZS28_006548 [Streblomastix strix]
MRNTGPLLGKPTGLSSSQQGPLLQTPERQMLTGSGSEQSAERVNGEEIELQQEENQILNQQDPAKGKEDDTGDKATE